MRRQEVSKYWQQNDAPWWYFDVKFPDTNGAFRLDEWRTHRSWTRHVPEPGIMVAVLLNMAPLLAWITLVTIGVGLYYELGQLRNPGWVVIVSKDYNQPFILTSFALALLLVFRTNSSYERWWSARRHFGQMYNDARSIARLTMDWVSPYDSNLASSIMRLTSALGPAACAYISEDVSIFTDLCELSLRPEELCLIRDSEQPPITVLLMISALLKSAPHTLAVMERTTIEERLVSFQIELGCLERIKYQPIYVPYTRHTSRFLVMYLTWLPFGLFAYLSWATIAVMPVLAFLLSGIENIGIHIEQPMMVLPVRSLAQSAKRTVEIIERTFLQDNFKKVLDGLTH